MFRSFSGSRAQYGDLTIVVVAEFNEYRVLVRGPDVAILGTRVFAEDKARAQGLAIARAYVEKMGIEPPADEPAWAPTRPDDWLVWQN